MFKKLSSIILALTLVLSVIPMRVMADDIVLGEGIEWSISDDGTLTVSGDGAITPAYDYKSFWESGYNDVIKKLVVADGITEVGGYVFSKLTNLEEVTIADSVKVISYGAFYECSGLKTVTLPEVMTTISTSAFSRCSALTDITMPKTLTDLHDQAFFGCSSLKSIEIPEGLTQIRYQTFADCTSLEKVTLPSTVTSLSDYIFSGCTALKTLTIPKSISYLSDYALAGMENLEEISLYGDLGQLQLIDGGLANKSTFILYPAKKQGTLKLPADLKYIENYAFQNCTGLTELELPVYLDYTFSPLDAFTGCTGLTSIKIPDSYMFYIYNYLKDNDIKNITVHDTSTTYASKDGIVYSKDFTKLIRYPWGREGAYTVPDGVTEIKDNTAFEGATKLTAISLPQSLQKLYTNFNDCDLIEEIYIPASVTGIYIGAFSGANSLKTVTIDENNTAFKVMDNAVYTIDGLSLWSAIGGAEDECIVPEGVTEIKNDAFNGTSKITSVILPQSVEKIGSNAFMNCTSLESIELPDTVTSFGSYVFSGCSSLKSVTIPSGAKSLDSAFSDCTALEYIGIPETVKSMRNISNCTSLDNVVIPKNVETVGFYGCTNLKNVMISEGVKTVGLTNCTAITEITLPSTLTSLSNTAFNGSTNLMDIYYTGTEKQFRRILQYNGDPFSSQLNKATIHYTPAVPLLLSKPQVVISDSNTYTLILNTSATASNSRMVAVLYNGDEIATGMTAITPQIGESTNTVKIKSEETAVTAKIFFWDSLDYMTPIAEPVEVKIAIPGGGSGGGGGGSTVVTPTEPSTGDTE